MSTTLTLTRPTGDSDTPTVEIEVKFTRDFPNRGNYHRTNPHYDPSPRYGCWVTIPEPGFVPEGKRLPTAGYLSVTFRRRSDLPSTDFTQAYVSSLGNGLFRSGVDYMREGIPSFMRPDLPDGYSLAILDDLADEIISFFDANVDEIEKKEREGDAARMEEKAEEAERYAHALKAEAAKAVSGAQYLTADEVAYDYGIKR